MDFENEIDKFDKEYKQIKIDLQAIDILDRIISIKNVMISTNDIKELEKLDKLYRDNIILILKYLKAIDIYSTSKLNILKEIESDEIDDVGKWLNSQMLEEL